MTVEGVVGGVHTTVMFKQIAGLIARRIICYKKPGDILEPGERIRGSHQIRVAGRYIFWAPNGRLAVQPGERVSAGSSVIARIHATREANDRGSMSATETISTPGTAHLTPARPTGTSATVLPTPCPTLFTAGNLFLGFYAMMEAFRGALLNAQSGRASRR